jgi:Xaa-Pro dipeptidase
LYFSPIDGILIPMNKETYLARIRKTQGEMKKQGVDLFAVSPSSNLRYLTGYAIHADERLLLLLLPAEGSPFVIANRMYQAQAEIMPIDSFVYWVDGDDPFASLKREVEKREYGRKRIALETQLPALFSVPLAKLFPDSEFVLGASLTGPLRQYKDREELALIRHACGESDKALAELLEKGRYWLGKTESEFADALAARFKRGGIGERFGAIAAVGSNAAVPHHVTGDRIIEDGKGLLLDFWGAHEGYFSDCSRTVHFGKPPAEFENVYNTVLEAHLAAEQAAQLGSPLSAVDDAARRVIEKAGYGEYFTHRTGHGLGLDEHEGAAAAKGETTPIAPGMVFSIEPGIYLPGKLGVRIENLVAITEAGAEALHHYPRELTVL